MLANFQNLADIAVFWFKVGQFWNLKFKLFNHAFSDSHKTLWKLSVLIPYTFSKNFRPISQSYKMLFKNVDFWWFSKILEVFYELSQYFTVVWFFGQNFMVLYVIQDQSTGKTTFGPYLEFSTIKFTLILPDSYMEWQLTSSTWIRKKKWKCIWS